MKIAITGHTAGLGKFLYNYFAKEGNEVIGFSRSNGFDLQHDCDKICDAANGSDVFINNTCCLDKQLYLFNQLANNVGKMIVMGSTARLWTDILATDYAFNKKKLYEAVFNNSIDKNSTPCLHLDLSFLEISKEYENMPNKVRSNYPIKYSEILGFVLLWLDNPVITNMQFRAIIDEDMMNELERTRKYSN